MADILLIIGCVVLMLVGLIGIVVPVLPDLVLIWVTALGYAVIIDWGQHGPIFFAVISILGLAGIAAEFWVSGMGAKRGGASGGAMVVGGILAIVAFFMAGPVGAVIALLLGIYIVEYIRNKDVESASRAMIGAGVGCGASLGIKLMLGLGMVATWVVWVITG